MRKIFSLCLLLILLSLFNTNLIAQSRIPQSRIPQSIAFVHVNVIPMDRKIVLKDQTVLIKGDRIVEIKPSKKFKLSPKVKQINATGKFLLPGFADMHIHDFGGKLEDDFLLYLANGVTLVRNMSGSQSSMQIKEKIITDELLAPHYFTTGPMLQTKQFEIPNQDKLPNQAQELAKMVTNHMRRRIITLNNEEDVATIIREHKKFKYDFIKIHDNFPKDLYLKLLKEAKKADIEVIGHAQRKLPLKYSTKLKSISHIEEFLHLFSEEQLQDVNNYPDLGKSVSKLKVTVSPTLLVFDMIHRYSENQKFGVLLKDKNLKYLPIFYRGIWSSEMQPYRSRKWFGTPEGQKRVLQQFEFLKKLTKAMNNAGVPLILGTDVSGFIIPGFSVHQELKFLVDAGLSPYDALRTTTWNVSVYLGKDKYNGGSIKKGKIADAVLLNENPLDDIQNTKNINGVLTKGKWLNRKKLDQLLFKVERKYRN